jgi:hypothetical protein
MAQNRAPIAQVQLRVERGRPDSWLVGAFLVLFGVAVSAAIPQIAGAVRLAVANASKAGPTHTAQRPTVRLHVLLVKATEPKLPGGHDLVFVALPAFFAALSSDRVLARPIDMAARIRSHGFSARAPPALSA